MQNSDEKYELIDIVRDADGYYRWTYEVDSRTNQSFLKLYLLIFALIILIPGAILFIMIFGRGKGSGAGAYLAIWMAVFAGVELLTYLIYKGIEKAKGGTTDIPYLMADDFIIVHPDKTRIPAAYLGTSFSAVKDVRLDLDSDLILLNEPLRVTHVYVPKDDIPFVLNYILDRVPQKGEYDALRERAERLLKGRRN